MKRHHSAPQGRGGGEWGLEGREQAAHAFGRDLAARSLRLERQLDLATGDIAGAIWAERLVWRRKILRRGSDHFWRKIAQRLGRKGPPTSSADRVVAMSKLP